LFGRILSLGVRRVAPAVALVGLAVSPAISTSASSGQGHFYLQPFHTSPVFAAAYSRPFQFPPPSVCEEGIGLACYTPQIIRTAYNVPSNLTGAGQTIVIVDAFGDPTVASDLHTFDTEFGLADPKLTVYYPSGKPTWSVNNGNDTGWASEISLDVQWSHAMAPGANIDLVVAKSNQDTDLEYAQSWAIHQRLGNILSESFGETESNIPDGAGNWSSMASHSDYQLAAQNGMSVFVSAGDWGSNFYGFPGSTGNSPIASFPANDPNVTAVAGTDLFAADNGAYQGEYVWNDSALGQCPFGCAYGVFGATGGAASQFYRVPQYQHGTGYAWRTTADVAWNASVYTAVMVYLGFYGQGGGNGFYFFGGTSEGAPSWAGITALADQAAGHGLGNLNPKMYALASYGGGSPTFQDVTFGQNGLFTGTPPGYNAGTGYDVSSGLGSPNVTNLINALISH